MSETKDRAQSSFNLNPQDELNDLISAMLTKE